MIKRIAMELLFSSFTIAGIGLVLITLTDQVLLWAIYISAISLLCHLAGVAIEYREENKQHDSTSSS